MCRNRCSSEPPNAGANTIAENALAGALVGITASAIDPEADKITYSLTDNAGGRFTITATAEWRVTWAATGLPPGMASNGNLGTINRTSTANVRVIEVQALNQGK